MVLLQGKYNESTLKSNQILKENYLSLRYLSSSQIMVTICDLKNISVK